MTHDFGCAAPAASVPVGKHEGAHAASRGPGGLCPVSALIWRTLESKAAN